MKRLLFDDNNQEPSSVVEIDFDRGINCMAVIHSVVDEDGYNIAPKLTGKTHYRLYVAFALNTEDIKLN